MNETIRCILGRRSIRSYEKRTVEKEKTELIVECGLFAPSARNTQPWYLSVVTDRAILNRISEENRKIMLQSDIGLVREEAKNKDFDSFCGAPMAIIVSGRKDLDSSKGDCANVMENMAIAAYSLGLDSLYIGSFRIALQRKEGAYLLEELKIPQSHEPLYALGLGYGNEELGERAPRVENNVVYL